MKKFLILLLMTCGATLSAQTDSIDVHEFLAEYEKMKTVLNEKYDGKDWKACEKLLLESVSLFYRQYNEQQSWNPQIIRNTYYYLASIYSLQNQKKKAVEAFEKSVELGLKEVAKIREDSDLDNIRKDKRFTELLNQLAEKYDYPSVLRSAAKYEKADTAGLPRFEYELPTNGRMKLVREYFKLDSIAGDGDEISKILNIMYWIHNNIRHDGGNYALSEFDAIDLYHYHKATGKGINCRHLAMALNEMYLSMGITSRYVTCMPKDSTDNDCHVINTVYSNDLKKWIWIDPTFAAFVKDENGNFLGINEVRERLIDGRPLVLNEDANWNNQSKQTKKYYLETYMAKNLYWLQTLEISKFSAESRFRNIDATYISLIPPGFYRNMIRNDVKTSDPDYFWQQP